VTVAQAFTSAYEFREKELRMLTVQHLTGKRSRSPPLKTAKSGAASVMAMRHGKGGPVSSVGVFCFFDD